MRVTLLAIGKQKAGPLRDLVQDYARRLTFPFEVKELEEKKKLPPAQLKAREGELILAAISPESKVIALDERGKSLTSEAFAGKLAAWRDEGEGEFVFIIGGADGLDDAVRRRADLILQFGTMVWPHQLVRVMLAEQLFRAQSIWSGHPYHRA